MLLQFSVKNFRSIKDRVVLSLESSGKKEHPNNYAEIEKESILKSVAIFGANASGKSNIFLALTAAILLIRKSNERQIGEPLSLIVPFRFDKHTSALHQKIYSRENDHIRIAYICNQFVQPYHNNHEYVLSHIPF